MLMNFQFDNCLVSQGLCLQMYNIEHNMFLIKNAKKHIDIYVYIYINFKNSLKTLLRLK